MKIVFYKDNLATGRGADHLVCSLATALAERGHKVALVFSKAEGEPTFDVSAEVAVSHVPEDRLHEFLISGFDVCVAAGPNEICSLTQQGHVESPIPTATMMLVAPRGFFKWRHPIRNHRIRKALGLSDLLQVQCKAYVDEVRKFAPDPIIEVIGQWPDVAFDAVEMTRKKVIIYPAAINKMKNQLMLLKAFFLIAKRFPDWELHLYGRISNAYGRKCKRLIETSAFEGQVKIFDFTKDLPRIYATSSIMAFPSLLEGFPLTLVEGMSYSLPSVVLLSLPAADEMVRHGETGLIVEPTIRSLADALSSLMKNPSRRTALGEAAQKFCQMNFTKQKTADAWEESLRRIVKRGVL